MGQVVTKDINKGYEEAMREVDKLKLKPHVKVGLQGPKGMRIHPKGDGASVVDIATFNEFGTSRMPERSFIRSTMDENYKALLSTTNKLFYKMGTGRMTTQRALAILGLQIQLLIKRKIVNLKEPPNAPVTIERKGSSNPLIDTSLMLNSVTFKVVNAGVGSDEGEIVRTPGGQRRAIRKRMRKRRNLKRSIKRNASRRSKMTAKRIKKRAGVNARKLKRKSISKAKHIKKRTAVNARKIKRKTISRAKHIKKRAGVNYRKAKRAARRRLRK